MGNAHVPARHLPLMGQLYEWNTMKGAFFVEEKNDGRQGEESEKGGKCMFPKKKRVNVAELSAATPLT